MTKMKLVPIVNCYECPCFYASKVSFTKLKVYCHHPKVDSREVVNPTIFPDWCPLEDAPITD